MGEFVFEILIVSLMIFLVGGVAAKRRFAQIQRLPGVLQIPSILILL